MKRTTKNRKQVRNSPISIGWAKKTVAVVAGFAACGWWGVVAAMGLYAAFKVLRGTFRLLLTLAILIALLLLFIAIKF